MPIHCCDCGSSPAIWLYPQTETDVEVFLTFHEGGFLTTSTPPYNAGWRVHVNPGDPFYKIELDYSSEKPSAFLDYDGFRAGSFQRERGWCIAQSDLLKWQREMLPKLGFTDSEIDDANYGYGRLLLERQYSQKFFAVYPQTSERVDSSVSLEVHPTPDTTYRLWLYFVPVDEQVTLPEPSIPPIERTGFTVVELAYVTDFEIPPSLPREHHLRTMAKGPASLLTKHILTTQCP